MAMNERVLNAFIAEAMERQAPPGYEAQPE